MAFIILYTSMLFCFVNTHQHVNHNLQNGQCYQKQDERILSRRHLGTQTVNPSLPADVLWGSFVTHSFLPYGPSGRNECVTNEPQRTSAGRLCEPFLIIKPETCSVQRTDVRKTKNEFSLCACNSC